jgi:hypothetical protein
VFESEAAVHVIGGGAETVRAMAHGDGGAAIAPGDELASTVATTPMDRG